MFKRICNLPKSNSFFLFGARGTGKTSLLQEIFPRDDVLWIDLLHPDVEEQFLNSPDKLTDIISARTSEPNWVVIDEVQKVPRILDVVHWEIENRKIKFALTGSSARKLKRGGANLLAGRAFLNHLYPLTHKELGERFQLEEVLAWGSLPKIFHLSEKGERQEFLKSYVNAYLREEVLQEQLVRTPGAFRKFLPIAAQMNGKLLNYNSIAQDLQIDWTTVRTYFEILEDTWIGFFLPAYDRSLRKQQLKANKFYFFDVGVQRALENMLTVPLMTSQQIGPLFEHFLIAEIFRLNDYLRRDFRLSYLATQGGLEIDLVVERPGRSPVLVEIKSTDNVREDHLVHLRTLKKEFPEFEAICLSREKFARKIDDISVFPWRQGFEELF